MIFKKLTCFILLMVSVLSINAQEKIASASIDKSKIDAAMLKIMAEKETKELISPLYSEWKNTGVRVEGNIPDVFDIDLRGFCMPTPSTTITSKYGQRWGRLHKGIDVKVYIGDTISAAFDGKVRVVNYDANGYGYYVVIRHSNGLETVYGHLSKQLVKANQIVKAGEPIGLGGNTGRSTGSHLHFETRLCGIAIDPSYMFDFVAQDVKGDYYRFVNSKSTKKEDKIVKK